MGRRSAQKSKSSKKSVKATNKNANNNETVPRCCAVPMCDTKAALECRRCKQGCCAPCLLGCLRSCGMSSVAETDRYKAVTFKCPFCRTLITFGADEKLAEGGDHPLKLLFDDAKQGQTPLVVEPLREEIDLQCVLIHRPCDQGCFRCLDSRLQVFHASRMATPH